MSEKIEIEICVGKNGIVPAKATEGSAGYDLYCPVDTKLEKGRGLIPLDICMKIPDGVAGIIKARSGFELKGFEVKDIYGNTRRIECDAKDGVIDSDYTNIIGVLVKNDDKMFNAHVARGTRIAQILFVPVYSVSWKEVEKITPTDRKGGFGSTGTK